MQIKLVVVVVVAIRFFYRKKDERLLAELSAYLSSSVEAPKWCFGSPEDGAEGFFLVVALKKAFSREFFCN